MVQGAPRGVRLPIPYVLRPVMSSIVCFSFLHVQAVGVPQGSTKAQGRLPTAGCRCGDTENTDNPHTKINYDKPSSSGSSLCV